MKEIYIVTTGRWDDKENFGVFTDKAEAERIVAALPVDDYPRIQEWAVDERVGEDNREVFEVSLDASGNVVYRERRSWWFSPDKADGFVTRDWHSHTGDYLARSPISFEHAEACAAEVRRQHLAEMTAEMEPQP